MSKRTVVQMMPANGWGAMVADEDLPEDQYVSPLIGWALVQDDGAQTVVGMIAGEQVDFCDQLSHFFGYVQTQDMLTEALSQMVDDIDTDEDDFDDDFGDDGDEPPLPPPSLRRKSGRLN